MMILSFALITTCRAAATFGDIYSDEHMVNQIIELQPATLTRSSEFCTFVPHSLIYTGYGVVQRAFSKLALTVEWGTLDGSKFDIEVVNLEENLYAQGADVFLYDEVYVEQGTAVGSSDVIKIVPHMEHAKFSDDEDFLSKFPDIVTRVCATNRDSVPKKVFLRVITMYEDNDIDVSETADLLDGEDLMQFLRAMTYQMATRLKQVKKTSLTLQELAATVYHHLISEELSPEHVAKVDKQLDKKTESDIYWRHLASADKIQHGIQDMALDLQVIQHTDDRRQSYMENVENKVNTAGWLLTSIICITSLASVFSVRGLLANAGRY